MLAPSSLKPMNVTGKRLKYRESSRAYVNHRGCDTAALWGQMGVAASEIKNGPWPAQENTATRPRHGDFEQTIGSAVTSGRETGGYRGSRVTQVESQHPGHLGRPAEDDNTDAQATDHFRDLIHTKTKKSFKYIDSSSMGYMVLLPQRHPPARAPRTGLAIKINIRVHAVDRHPPPGCHLGRARFRSRQHGGVPRSARVRRRGFASRAVAGAGDEEAPQGLEDGHAENKVADHHGRADLANGPQEPDWVDRVCEDSDLHQDRAGHLVTDPCQETKWLAHVWRNGAVQRGTHDEYAHAKQADEKELPVATSVNIKRLNQGRGDASN
ncbi:hypothetical protein CSUB01_03537 [Colletotrichum sublineola]|uniref:Uncharacterized protein n=1 Tax=Colletotrichum sublineola TaxID=1173701 RepID=A0A066XC58_COLSU|nr:hypothetical protein CSUB01_03537 [Colletotrichum sublineola]